MPPAARPLRQACQTLVLRARCPKGVPFHPLGSRLLLSIGEYAMAIHNITIALEGNGSNGISDVLRSPRVVIYLRAAGIEGRR
jgi:hypothetical protein